MEIWILMVYMKSAAFITFNTVEFNGKAACEAALVEVKKFYSHDKSVCVPKGIPETKTKDDKNPVD